MVAMTFDQVGTPYPGGVRPEEPSHRFLRCPLLVGGPVR